MVLLWLASAGPGLAILFQATDDPAHNTTAPTGDLQDSGWQWLGTWGIFLGTPVHSKYFLTAAHVGGRVGNVFRFRGENYVTRSKVVVPHSDLSLWGICGVFPDFAPLHTGRDLAGRMLIWFGRGTERGVEVGLTNQETAELRGWRWGSDTRVTRWGENRVEESMEFEGIGHLLRAAFDPDDGPNECHLSRGDSGGPAFVFEDGRWELAGIHYAVDGPYSYTEVGPGFDAALFNHHGFFWRQDSAWVPITELESDPPGSLYSTEVAAYADWILEFLAGPVPPEDAPFLQHASLLEGPFQDLPGAEVDWEQRTIRTELPTDNAFFRVRSCEALRLTGPTIDQGRLVFGYE